MSELWSYPDDVFTEPVASPDTLGHLGPLARLAGTWHGVGTDVHPVAEGTDTDAYTEVFDAHPIDAQTNGPQLFYGLRYHQHVLRPGRAETFHDQVGYLLWEPAEHLVLMTLAIPRGQVAMAVGGCAPDATTFTLTAVAGDPNAGIVTNPFLDDAFRTTRWEITFRTGPGDTWSYEQVTTLQVRGRPGSFAHTDTSTLVRAAAAVPNPLATAPRDAVS